MECCTVLERLIRPHHKITTGERVLLGSKQSNQTVSVHAHSSMVYIITLTVLVMAVDPQWEGMGDVGSARYEPALPPPCPTIRVLSHSN